MGKIHSTAVVSPKAQLGMDVEIGPFVVIEDDVVIGDECRFAGRVTVKSGTRMGPANCVAEGSVLGGTPQHLRAGDALGPLLIGSHNSIRENCTIHRGLTPDHGTQLGDRNLLMVNAHVAHDCRIGNNTILVNNCLVGGHVEIGDGAYLGGAAAIHQFCRVGRLAMVGGKSHVTQDVAPFVTVDGKSHRVVGVNAIGLRRAGFSPQDIKSIKQAYRIIYRSGLKWSDVVQTLCSTFAAGPAAEFAPFLMAGERGFVLERRVPRAATVAFSPKVTGEEAETANRKAG